jgi:TRAP-type C4-dicarboxylate transport system substrate-binding protein
MFSGTFWAKLPPDLQKIALDIWAANIPAYSANVLQAQREARAIMEANGVKFHEPTPEAAVALRVAMTAHQDEVAKEIKVSPEMVKLAMQDLGPVA